MYSPAVTHVKVSLKGGVVSRSVDGLEQRDVVSIKKCGTVNIADDTVNIHGKQCWPKYAALRDTGEDCRAGRG